MIDRPRLILAVDPAHGDDLAALVVALQMVDGLEIVYANSGPGSDIERGLEAFRASLPEIEVAKEPAPSLPYWRRFERKRRSR